jgi:hypothetical protein
MRHYLQLVGLLSAVLVGVIGGINWFINPYGYFDGPRLDGINSLPLGFNNRLRLAKALAVSRLRPATVILGNSRAEAGYDADHSGLADQPAYNLALGGAGLGEARRYLLEAAAAGRLRQVLLALDLAMFDPSLKTQETDADSVLITAASGTIDRSREWRRLAFILFSGTAWSDSVWSVTHQRKPVTLYLPSGRRDESADLAQTIREGGHRSASLRVEATFLAASLRDADADGFHRSDGQGLGQLRQVVSFAAERNIRLILLINPIHARQTYLLSAAGLWPLYEQWKRDLSAVASTRPDLVSLWDFSGVSACTAEPMPPEDDPAISMRWFRESSHFRRVLGDQVLDRIFGRPVDGSCPGLGGPLEPADVAATLARQRQALGRWVKEHPEDAAEIDELARRYGRR